MSAYFIQNWECYHAIWNFGGRSARSCIFNVCPTIRQEIDNEHEIVLTIIVQNWQKTKTKKSKTKNQFPVSCSVVCTFTMFWCISLALSKGSNFGAKMKVFWRVCFIGEEKIQNVPFVYQQSHEHFKCFIDKVIFT